MFGSCCISLRENWCKCEAIQSSGDLPPLHSMHPEEPFLSCCHDVHPGFQLQHCPCYAMALAHPMATVYQCSWTFRLVHCVVTTDGPCIGAELDPLERSRGEIRLYT